jgi:hypothetical protein
MLSLPWQLCSRINKYICIYAAGSQVRCMYIYYIYYIYNQCGPVQRRSPPHSTDVGIMRIHHPLHRSIRVKVYQQRPAAAAQRCRGPVQTALQIAAGGDRPRFSLMMMRCDAMRGGCGRTQIDRQTADAMIPPNRTKPNQNPTTVLAICLPIGSLYYELIGKILARNAWLYLPRCGKWSIGEVMLAWWGACLFFSTQERDAWPVSPVLRPPFRAAQPPTRRRLPLPINKQLLSRETHLICYCFIRK